MDAWVPDAERQQDDERAILHHKNALFFKTANGAHVGAVFINLIHTCQLGGVIPSTI